MKEGRKEGQLKRKQNLLEIVIMAYGLIKPLNNSY